MSPTTGPILQEVDLPYFMNIGNDGKYFGNEVVYLYKGIVDLKKGTLNLTSEHEGLKHDVLGQLPNRLFDIPTGDFVLEFGVGAGSTLNFLGGLLNDRKVWGFESGNGFGERQEYRYTRKEKRRTKKLFDVLAKDGKTMEPMEVTSTIELELRTNDDDIPFLPFVPLCNVAVVLGDIRITLDQFIAAQLQKREVDVLFFDMNSTELSQFALRRAIPYCNPKGILVVSDVRLPLEHEQTLPEHVARAKDLSIVTQYDHHCGLRYEGFIQQPPTGEEKAELGSISKFLAAEKNVLHFNSKNRDKELALNKEASDLAQRLIALGCDQLESDCATLQYAISRAREKRDAGTRKMICMEFGFCSGRSLNFMSALLQPGEHLYGFDSGEGLPINWRYKFPKGTFRYQQTWEPESHRFRFRDPDLLPNNRMALPFTRFHPERCSIRAGLFDEQIPALLSEVPNMFTDAFLGVVHIDSDLKSSAVDILAHLGDQIVNDGTIVILDEGYNFQGDLQRDGHKESAFKHYEFAAVQEFAQYLGLEEPIYRALNINGQQLVLSFAER